MVTFTLDPFSRKRNIILFRLIIVIIDLGTELLLLDHGLLLVLACLTGFLGLLVFELAVVHDLAHRRLGIRCHFDQVEICIVRELSGILDSDDANLLPIRADKADLGDSDALINASFCADRNS